MNNALPAPTAYESWRFEVIKREIGCIACYQDSGGILGTPGDAHHLISEETGNRISHSHTIPLCKRHHDGPYGIHKRKLWFAERYGSDGALLIDTDQLVDDFKTRTTGGPA